MLEMPTSSNEALARDIISAQKANGFRIVVIGLFCVNIGPQMIHSLIHRRGGPVFFVPSLIPFLVMLWLLRKGDVHTREPK
jgi:exosortase/archaeosortase family protein